MAERGAFFEGGREPFPGGKKVPFPPQTPPILPKTAHMLFCPTGQSLPTGRTAPEKKQGEMPQGTTILSVKPRPGKYPSKGEAGRDGDPPPASTKKESVVHPAWPPGNACSAFLFPQAKKGKPSASAYGPVTSGHARQCHTIRTTRKAGGLLWPCKGLLPAAPKDAGFHAVQAQCPCRLGYPLKGS